MSAGLRPRSHWGSLQRSTDPLAGCKGAASRQEGNGGGGKDYEEGEGRGKGEWEREGKGEVGGNSALVVGDRRP